MSSPNDVQPAASHLTDVDQDSLIKLTGTQDKPVCMRELIPAARDEAVDPPKQAALADTREEQEMMFTQADNEFLKPHHEDHLIHLRGR